MARVRYRFGWSALALALSASCAAGVWARAYPPTHLVSLENPARAAVLRHDIVCALEPDTGRLTVQDQVTLLHAPGISVSEPVPFFLWRDLAITAPAVSSVGEIELEEPARLNPRGFWHRPPYDELDGYQNARELRLTLRAAPGDVWPETLRVTLSYAGVVRDSLKAPSEAYGRSFETTAGLIEPRGVYLASSSFWIPSRPDELFTYALSATVPAGWRAVSQGDLASPLQPPAGPVTDRWDCPQPMQEAYLVAGPWQVREVAHRGVRCQTWTRAETDSTIYNRYLRGTGRYLDLYGDLIGPYAFGKFALVENFWQSGYGMPSFTLLGDRVIRLPFILDTSYGHEILHNWWGNGVFVDAEQGNWCEGLTVYGADYLYKEREGSAAARQYRLDALKGVLNDVGRGEDLALRDFRERHDAATAAIGYSKSMMVLHQARRAVGEEAFWGGLRDFYRDQLWRRASWGDLFGAIEARARQVPGAAFSARETEATWIARPGTPRLRLADCRVERVGTGFRVHGRQEASGAWFEAGGFADARLELRPLRAGAPCGDHLVPLVVEFADGGDSTFGLPYRSGGFEVELDRAPRALALDPNFEVMRLLDRSEIPAAIGQTLSPESLVVVFSADLTPAQREAWQPLVTGWSKAKTLGVVEEANAPPGWLPNKTTFLIGCGRVARALAATVPDLRLPAANEDGWAVGDRSFPVGHSIIAVGPLPARSELAWMLLEIPDPALVRTVDAKVPHYSKYSWLAFDGPSNVGKGSWVHTGSPLRVELEAQ
ncbi:MAG: hypothetical protein IT349_00440 [Candidatus Eisenbacteria bacterium]|nr:hypothetical protein [Candidatus Eisenbacteria bacterium]